MINLYFGLPGSGKTTTIAAFAKYYLKGKKYQHVYCNIPLNLDGIITIYRDDLGVLDISDGLVLYDEGGIDFDNRDFANFNKNLTWFFKFHRHCKLDVFIFSQTIDVDKKIRALANNVFYIYTPAITGSFITKVVRIHYGIVFPSKETTGSKVGDIAEGYAAPNIFAKIFAKRIVRPKYYKYFDSYSIDRNLTTIPAVRVVAAAKTEYKSVYDRLKAFGGRLYDAWRVITDAAAIEYVLDSSDQEA